MKDSVTFTPEIFSVMSINLRFGLANDGPNSWEYRKKSYSPLFASFSPDFIGMQEANDFQTDHFHEMLTQYEYIGKRDPSPPSWQNNIIFYKHPWKCISHDRIFLSDTPYVPSRMPKSIWPRQCVSGVFTNSGKKVVCVNTHFDFEEEVQIKSAKIIRDRLNRYPADLPIIIMGDFNANPGSACYKELVSSAHPKNSFRDIFQGMHSSTYHGFTGENSGRHIDWILYRGSLALKEKKIIKDRFNGYYPSDHYPVLATFQWAEGPLFLNSGEDLNENRSSSS